MPAAFCKITGRQDENVLNECVFICIVGSQLIGWLLHIRKSGMLVQHRQCASIYKCMYL